MTTEYDYFQQGVDNIYSCVQYLDASYYVVIKLLKVAVLK